MRLVAETATLADAVARAARVSPTRGAAFLKSAGVMLELRPNGVERLVVKATDLEITYRQRVSIVEMGDEDADWRFPAQLLAGVLSTFPMSSGSQTVLEYDPKTARVEIRCGKKKARLPLISTDFPRIDKFDESMLDSVSDFASRVTQVEWAMERNADSSVLAGIHITGDLLVACDRTRLAQVPCQLPAQEPITVPLGPVMGLLRNVSDVRLGVNDYRLLLMPDQDTQITSTVFEAKYPNFSNAMRENTTFDVTVGRIDLESAISGPLVLAKGEKLPLIKMTFGKGSIHLEIDVDEVGVMEDEIDCIDGPDDEWSIFVTPQNILSALGGATSDMVTLKLGPKSDQTIVLVDKFGYRADLMPRVVSVAGAPSKGAAA